MTSALRACAALLLILAGCEKSPTTERPTADTGAEKEAHAASQDASSGGDSGVKPDGDVKGDGGADGGVKGDGGADSGVKGDGGAEGDGGVKGDGGDLPKIIPGEIKIVAGAMQVEVEPDAGKSAAKAKKKPIKKKPTKKKKPKEGVKKKPARSGGSVMKTIRGNMNQVESCYGAVASKDPTIGGKIVMQWTLGASGKPSAARVKKDTLKDKSVGQCIARKSKNWSFPPPSGGVGVVSYTYRLRMQ